MPPLFAPELSILATQWLIEIAIFFGTAFWLLFLVPNSG